MQGGTEESELEELIEESANPREELIGLIIGTGGAEDDQQELCAACWSDLPPCRRSSYRRIRRRPDQRQRVDGLIESTLRPPPSPPCEEGAEEGGAASHAEEVRGVAHLGQPLDARAMP